MNHMGLFEGIGGFSLAARWAGWNTPVMVEWNTYNYQTGLQ
jgi:site-specific DNA-cytosine methylase